MRTILRAVLVIALLLVVGFIGFGYWTGGSWRNAITAPATAGATGTVDAEKARERGAQLGEKAAVAAAQVERTIDEAAISTKIKAKMALDDSIKARSVVVSTTESTVTLTGTVHSVAERDRAVTLARETAGVRRVVDHLVVRASHDD